MILGGSGEHAMALYTSKLPAFLPFLTAGLGAATYLMKEECLSHVTTQDATVNGPRSSPLATRSFVNARNRPLLIPRLSLFSLFILKIL
jgi:hypothetical protein